MTLSTWNFIRIRGGVGEVRAIDQFWDYLENGLLKAAYGNTSTLGIPQTDVPLLPALGGDEFLSNRILGAIQMRALKVTDGWPEFCRRVIESVAI